MNQAVQYRQLDEVITERLRTAIINGGFRPGQWQRRQQIADDVGLARYRCARP